MKKFAIACAVVLAACLSSCGDTNYCYQITATSTILGVTTSADTYLWGTSNDLDAAIAAQEDAFEKMGLTKDAFEVSYKRTSKSQSDCHK